MTGVRSESPDAVGATANLPKVILLCGGGLSSKILFHALRKEFYISKVIWEEKEGLWLFVRRRLRRYGAVRTLGQCLFRALVMPVIARRTRRRVNEIILEQQWTTEPVPEELILRVSSVNSPDVRRALQSLAPTVVVVNGTRIIRREILEAVEAPFVNTHAGITPAYRGVHGGYWALCDAKPEHVGTTVHIVDKGIDTGAVISQATFKVTRRDSFASLPLLHLAAGIPLLKNAIRQIYDGALELASPPVLPSVLRTHPTIWFYLWMRLTKGIK